MSFSGNYFIPFYNYIIVIFVLVMVISIVGATIGYFYLGLSWSNSHKKYNPIVNMLNTMDLRSTIMYT